MPYSRRWKRADRGNDLENDEEDLIARHPGCSSKQAGSKWKQSGNSGDDNEADSDKASEKEVLVRRAEDILQAHQLGTAMCEMVLKCFPIEKSAIEGAGDNTGNNEEREEGRRKRRRKGKGKEEELEEEGPSVISMIFAHCLKVSLQGTASAESHNDSEDVLALDVQTRNRAAERGRGEHSYKTRYLYRTMLAPLHDPHSCSMLLLLFRQHVPMALLMGSGKEVLAVIRLFLDSSVSKFSSLLTATAASMAVADFKPAESASTQPRSGQSLSILELGEDHRPGHKKPLIQVIGEDATVSSKDRGKGTAGDKNDVGTRKTRRRILGAYTIEVEDILEGCSVSLAMLDALLSASGPAEAAALSLASVSPRDVSGA